MNDELSWAAHKGVMAQCDDELDAVVFGKNPSPKSFDGFEQAKAARRGIKKHRNTSTRTLQEGEPAPRINKPIKQAVPLPPTPKAECVVQAVMSFPVSSNPFDILEQEDELMEQEKLTAAIVEAEKAKAAAEAAVVDVVPSPSPRKIAPSTPIARRTRQAKTVLDNVVEAVVKAVSPHAIAAKSFIQKAFEPTAKPVVEKRATRASSRLRSMSAAPVNSTHHPVHLSATGHSGSAKAQPWARQPSTASGARRGSTD